MTIADLVASARNGSPACEQHLRDGL